MPRGLPPKEKISAKMGKAIKGLNEVPQGYTVSPEPKNKFGTRAMPKDLKAKYKKNLKEAQKIMKTRMNEDKRVKEARKKK